MIIKTTQVVALTTDEEEALKEACEVIERIYYELNLKDPIKFENDDIANRLDDMLDYLKEIL